MIILALALCAMLGGCAGAPKPAVLQLEVASSLDANPDARGRASPVQVRVYQLRSRAAFDAADFFSLYEQDQTVLGADLAGKDEMTLVPGAASRLETALPPGVEHIGVMVAFRDVEQTQWRAAAAVPGTGTVALRVDIGARQVRVAAP